MNIRSILLLISYLTGLAWLPARAQSPGQPERRDTLRPVIDSAQTVVRPLTVLADSALGSLMKSPRNSPRRATLLSLALPGLGQAYNRSYWKMPLIYAGLATAGYFIVANNVAYREYANAYVQSVQLPAPATITVQGFTYPNNAGASQNLRKGRDFYRRNFELSIIAVIAGWGITILEANVDAHLKDWDMSDNLSLRLKPRCSQDILPYSVPGLTLALQWKK